MARAAPNEDVWPQHRGGCRALTGPRAGGLGPVLHDRNLPTAELRNHTVRSAAAMAQRTGLNLDNPSTRF